MVHPPPFRFHLMKVSSSEYLHDPGVTQEALDNGAIHQASLPFDTILYLLDYRLLSFLKMAVPVCACSSHHWGITFVTFTDASLLSKIKTQEYNHHKFVIDV